MTTFLDPQTLPAILEAILFAAGSPMDEAALKRVCERALAEASPDERSRVVNEVPNALQTLQTTWSDMQAARGFTLVAAAEGLTFRTQAPLAPFLRAMRKDRPQRLSRATLETLAIIAYRQPATKPEVDDVRGVDCGGTIRALLERNLVRIVGKKDEPGRPLLYGTTKEFLSLFNLQNLAQLPSLREFHELNEAAEDALLGETLPSFRELADTARSLRLIDEPEVAALEDAVLGLKDSEHKARAAFGEQGIRFVDEEETPEQKAEP